MTDYSQEKLTKIVLLRFSSGNETPLHICASEQKTSRTAVIAARISQLEQLWGASVLKPFSSVAILVKALAE